ncbi:hypothetical protein CkaCkLH20_02887 [Colletotrichum karsti]|uniref:DUF6546 domain-containing protein n=1 Tax=Colletotrichum karsti TaxID=1095194 RepID=A0A9P6LKF6_9PEZI|nr:uncharacterized protein CkaCkLH20_02887 [Colletotrichum karsti]KAF9879344.1 hypothetical protein CkaCkLH20_02887 [Colletotrichum karsti]
MKNPMATWNGLPAELRGLIMDYVAIGAQEYNRSKASKGKKASRRRGMGGYAVVCKQWQCFIEKHNFRTLEVGSARDLSRFDQIMKDPRRRSLLRRVSLRVELPRYSKKLAKVPETDIEMDENEVMFTRGIWNLFDILSKWTLERPEGIELELGAASPSDKPELFGEAGLDENSESRFFSHELDFSWITAGCEQVGRHGLPEVSVVSSCHILRKNHRNFSSHALLTIFSSLPKLREIRYEPWHQIDMESQLEVDSDLARTMPFYPSHINRVSIFEHFDAFNDGAGGEEWEDADSSSSSSSDDDNDDHDDGYPDNNEDNGGDDESNTSGDESDAPIDPLDTDPFLPERTECRSLAKNLAYLSLQAEEMAVSNMADASTFFGSLLSNKTQPPVWTNLRRLTLTSHTMLSGIEPEQINKVLHLTATAAKQMPALKMLELYKVDQFGAAVFRYTVDTMSTTASWESTWEFRTEERVRTAWSAVASKNTNHELEFLPEVMLGEYRGPFIFINENLRSKDLVVHPASLADMLAKEMNKCNACHGFCAYPKPNLPLGLTPTASTHGVVDLTGDSE